MDRESLSTILNRPVKLVDAGNGRTITIHDATSDDVLAQVDIDDLFDGDGNRFHNDMP